MIRKLLVIIPVSLALLVIAIGTWVYFDIEGSFWRTERHVESALTNKSKSIQFVIDKEGEYPHTIEYVLNGKIDGQGVIGFGWNDTMFYSFDTVNNNFTVERRFDWYSDSCIFVYRPINATQGFLKIDCNIYSGRK